MLADPHFFLRLKSIHKIDKMDIDIPIRGLCGRFHEEFENRVQIFGTFRNRGYLVAFIVFDAHVPSRCL